ncbi:hypothetical protein RUM43_009875 [Polyplax serrata]|uniref:Uncharacterized protein n=1 Tax=Polyplax serrata TaxID=468196 RepID=A0AAN8Q413_POLSC
MKKNTRSDEEKVSQPCCGGVNEEEVGKERYTARRKINNSIPGRLANENEDLDNWGVTDENLEIYCCGLFVRQLSSNVAVIQP